MAKRMVKRLSHLFGWLSIDRRRTGNWLFRAGDSSPPLLLQYPALFLGHDQEPLQVRVYEVQSILQKKGFSCNKTGVFDEQTVKAVKEFQHSEELQEDGWVGSLTWAALLYPSLSTQIKISQEHLPYVKDLQKTLRHEKLPVRVDGVFGKHTERALKQAQRAYGIRPDGICGPLTWSLLKGQRPIWDNNAKGQHSFRFALEQVLMVLSIQLGMYFNPFNVGVDIPFINSLVASYSLTFCVHPFLEPIFADYLMQFDLPLLKFAP